MTSLSLVVGDQQRRRIVVGWPTLWGYRRVVGGDKDKDGGRRQGKQKMQNK